MKPAAHHRGSLLASLAGISCKRSSGKPWPEARKSVACKSRSNLGFDPLRLAKWGRGNTSPHRQVKARRHYICEPA